MYVLIPAYQPDARLPRLILELHRADSAMRIVVVDDGSGEEYRDIFDASRTAGAHVISYERNRGKGYALRAGFTYIYDHAQSLGINDCVVTADADGQHTLVDIFRVGQACATSNQSVLGVREFVGHVPARSRIGNSATSGLFWLATGWKLKDTQTGLRAFPIDLLPTLIGIEGDRYEYELRVLLQLAKYRHPVTQIPIETIYEAGNPTSHFRPLQDSARIWAPLLKFAASSGIATVIDYVLVLLLNALTGTLLFPVVAARLVSASVNFTMNRHVFEAKTTSLRRSAMRYASLALAVVAGSYIMLSVMTSLGMPLWLAKIIADTTMYLVSYSAQSRYVFAPEKEASGRQENTLDHSVSVQATAADLQDSKPEASLPTPATPTPAAVHSLRARAAVGSHNDTFRLSRAS